MAHGNVIIRQKDRNFRKEIIRGGAAMIAKLKNNMKVMLMSAAALGMTAALTIQRDRKSVV